MPILSFLKRVAQGDKKPGGGVFGFLANAVPGHQAFQEVQAKTNEINQAISKLPKSVQQQLAPQIESLNKNKEPNVPSLARRTAQSIPSDVIQLGMTAERLMHPEIPQPSEIKPTNPITRFALGTQPIKPIQTSYSESRQAGHGIPFALGMAGLTTLGDLPIFPGSKVGVNALARASTAEDATKLLVKGGMAEDIAKSIAPQVALTKDKYAIKNIIDKAQPTQPAIPAPGKPNVPEVVQSNTSPVKPISDIVPNGVGAKTQPTDIVLKPGQGLRQFPESVKTSPTVQTSTSLTPEKLAESIKSIPFYHKLQATSFKQAAEQISADPAKALNEAMTTSSKPLNDIQIGKRLTLLAENLQTGRSEIAGKISESLAPVGTENARALAMFNTINRATPSGAFHWAKELGAEDSAANNFYKRAVEIQQMADGQEKELARFNLTKDIQGLKPSSATEQAVDFWRSMLLTFPTTTAGNIMSNIAEGATKQGLVNPVAVGYDWLTSLATGKRSRSLTFGGLGRGTKEGTQRSANYMKTGYDPANPLGKYQGGGVTYSDTTLGNIGRVGSEIPYRFMAAQDMPFRYAQIDQTMRDLAVTEAKNQGIKGAERKSFVEKYLVDPPAEAVGQAVKEGARAVFGNETKLGDIAAKARTALGPAGKVLIPFSQVPASIATRIIDRSPFGLIKAAREIRKGVKTGEFDQRAFTEAMANATVGTAGAVLVGKELSDHGLITLGYPSDPREQQIWKLEGRQAYSVKMGNKWLSLNYVQPFGSIMAYGAAFSQAQKAGKNPTDSVATAIGQAAKSVTSQSFLQGLSGALQAVQDPERSAGKYIKQMAGSLTPNIIKGGTRAFDEYQRVISNPLDAWKATLPGLRQTLPKDQNALGQPLKRQTSILNTMFNPLRPSDIKSTSVVNELRRLQDAGAGVGVDTVQKTMTFDKIDAKLTEAQQRDLTQRVGKLVEAQWNKVITSSYYQDLSLERKAALLRSVHSKIMAQQKNIFAKENKLGRYSSTYREDLAKLRENQ